MVKNGFLISQAMSRFKSPTITKGENMSSMKIFYTIPFKTSNGKTSILITQGTTQKGYVSLIHFLSKSRYITWNIVVSAEDAQFFHFNEIKAAYELAMKVVYANRVHKLNNVVLEVA